MTNKMSFLWRLFFFVHLQQIDAKILLEGPLELHTRVTQGKRLQTRVRPELNCVSE